MSESRKKSSSTRHSESDNYAKKANNSTSSVGDGVESSQSRRLVQNGQDSPAEYTTRRVPTFSISSLNYTVNDVDSNINTSTADNINKEKNTSMTLTFDTAVNNMDEMIMKPARKQSIMSDVFYAADSSEQLQYNASAGIAAVDHPVLRQHKFNVTKLKSADLAGSVSIEGKL
jgi:hypothetical protein